MSNGSTFVSTHCWANNVCQFDLSLRDPWYLDPQYELFEFRDIDFSRSVIYSLSHTCLHVPLSPPPPPPIAFCHCILSNMQHAQRLDSKCLAKIFSSCRWNHGLFTNGCETRSCDAWKPVSNRTPGIISKICKLGGGTPAPVCSGLLGPYKISHGLMWGKMTRAW